MSAADTLVDQLRAAILNGELGGRTPLREQAIADRTGAARHTVREALRGLAAEGLVVIEPNRGASVRSLVKADVLALSELRIALEVEAARLALQRHDGTLPESVHEANRALTAACEAGGEFFSVTTAHADLHSAIVSASESPRIVGAHALLAGELRLFLIGLRALWEMGDLAAEHSALLSQIEAEGPETLRVHIRTSSDALTAGLMF